MLQSSAFEITSVVSLCSLLVLPLAPAGLIVMYAALTRGRNAAHAALSSLLAISVGMVAFVLLGARLLGAPGAPDWMPGGAAHAWNWMAHPSSFIVWTNAGQVGWLLAQMIAVALVCLIPAVAASERWRMAPAAAMTVFLAALLYPLYAHAVRAGGWIATLARPASVANFRVDPGGAASIQVLGALAALALVWVIGSREGKYDSAGRPMALPGHHLPQVMYGALLAWPGWVALNLTQWAASGFSTSGQMMLIILNTWLAAPVGALAALLTSRWRFTKPDASLTGNGWVAGLVVSSAACGTVPPAAMIALAAAGGALTVLAVEFFEVRLHIDDPSGAIAVHGVAGFWGLLAGAAFSAHSALAMQPGILPESGLATVVAVLTLLGAALPALFLVALLLGRLIPHRVAPEAEQLGLDLHELGGGAFPDFMNSGDNW